MMGLLTGQLIAGVFFAVAARRPQTAVLALLALVPFQGMLRVAPVTTVAWKEMATLAILAGCVLARQRRDSVALVPWMWPLALLVPFGVVSALATHGVPGLFGIKIAFFYLILAVIVAWFPFTRRDKDHLVTLLLATGTISAFYGLAQQLMGGPMLVSMGYKWGEEVRAAGPLLRSFSTFNQPFPFALYVMLVLLVCGAAALGEPGRLRSRAFWLLAPVLLAGMGVSVVRASYIGLIVGVVVLTAVLYKRLVVGMVVGAAGLAGLMGIALITGGDKVVATMFSSSSLQEREDHWRQNIVHIATQPFGQGLGSTGSAAGKVIGNSDVTVALYQPDNQYIKIALELGPVGVALYAAVVALMMVTLYRVMRVQSDPLEKALAGGALAVTAGACVAAWFATYLEIFPLDVLFWVLPAVAACIPQSVARRGIPGYRAAIGASRG